MKLIKNEIKVLSTKFMVMLLNSPLYAHKELSYDSAQISHHHDLQNGTERQNSQKPGKVTIVHTARMAIRLHSNKKEDL